MKKIILEEHILTPGTSVTLSPGMDPTIAADVRARLVDLEELRLPEMDRYGITMQVLSIATGLQQEADAGVAVKKIKQANDMLAEIVRKYPTRFAAFAAVPFQDAKAAADELERAVTQLGLKGALVNGHSRGEMLDEQKFWPVWERAEALGVPIYLHPGEPLPGQVNKMYEGYPELTGALWSWGCEVGTYTLRLIFSGLFDAFPRTALILGHMGEMLPYVLWRLDSRASAFTKHRSLKKTPSEYIKENIFITTSGQFSNDPLQCALTTLGADHVLFSVDYPFESTEAGVRFIEAAQISEEDREKICYKNAERLLKL